MKNIKKKLRNAKRLKMFQKEVLLALIKAEEAFNLWMDIYPESESWPDKLKAQKAHDQFMDHIGLNPKNGE